MPPGAVKTGWNPQQQESYKIPIYGSLTVEIATKVSGLTILLSSQNIFLHNKHDAIRVFVEMPSKDTKEFRDAISTERQRVLDEVRELVETNQKGQFEDDGGNICWYLDDLLSALKETEESDDV